MSNIKNQIKIELYQEQQKLGTYFYIKNRDKLGDLDFEMLIDFATNRGGGVNPNTDFSFWIKKRWSVSYTQKVLNALEINAVVKALTPSCLLANEEVSLSDNFLKDHEKILFGIHSGKSWSSLSEGSLKTISIDKNTYDKFTRNMALYYLSLKNGTKNKIPFEPDMVVDFGIHKGMRWIDLPIRYLEWMETSNLIKGHYYACEVLKQIREAF